MAKQINDLFGLPIYIIPASTPTAAPVVPIVSGSHH
jgi:hypothetical protein